MFTQKQIEAAERVLRSRFEECLVEVEIDHRLGRHYSFTGGFTSIVEAALEAAEAAAWQPIETAPKDEWILLWVVAEKQQCAMTGTISESEEGKIWNGNGYQPNLATHWQPLPSPPEN